MKKLMKLALIMLIALVVLMSANSVKATTENTIEGETGNPGSSEETPGGEEENPPVEDDDENEGETGGEDEEEPEEPTWTDGTKVGITIESDANSTDTRATGYMLVTKGLDYNNGNTYIYISVGSKSQVTYDSTGKPDNSNFRTNTRGEYYLNNLYLNGKIYVTIIETKYDVDNSKWISKEIVKDREIARPDLTKVGLRVQAYFHNEKTTTFIWEPMSARVEGRKINIKVGNVTDKEILKAIKNGESNCLERLLAYAKTAPSIYQNTVPAGESAGIVNEMGLSNGGYYYVYFELEDEDGKYYPIEDVSLYQAQITNDEKLNFLTDYLSDQFVWNLDEEPQKPADEIEQPKQEEKKDDTVIPDKKLPQTGQTLIGLGIGGTVLALGIVFAIKSKKYSI